MRSCVIEAGSEGSVGNATMFIGDEVFPRTAMGLLFLVLIVHAVGSHSHFLLILP